MRLVVTSSTGAEIAPKSTAASSNAQKRRNGMPRYATGIAAVVNGGGTVSATAGEPPSDVPAGCRSKSSQSRSPDAYSVDTSTRSGAGREAATLAPYSSRSGRHVPPIAAAGAYTDSNHPIQVRATPVTTAALAPPSTGNEGRAPPVEVIPTPWRAEYSARPSGTRPTYARRRGSVRSAAGGEP